MNLWGVEEQRAQEAKPSHRSLWSTKVPGRGTSHILILLALFPVPVHLSQQADLRGKKKGKKKKTHNKNKNSTGSSCVGFRDRVEGRFLNGRSSAFYIFLFFCSWQALKKNQPVISVFTRNNVHI